MGIRGPNFTGVASQEINGYVSAYHSSKDIVDAKKSGARNYYY